MTQNRMDKKGLGDCWLIKSTAPGYFTVLALIVYGQPQFIQAATEPHLIKLHLINRI